MSDTTFITSPIMTIESNRDALIEAFDKYIKNLHRDIRYKDKALEKKNRLIKYLQEELKATQQDRRLQSLFKAEWEKRGKPLHAHWDGC